MYKTLLASLVTFMLINMYVLLWLDSVSFKYDDHSVREDEAVTNVELILSEPASSDRVIQVYSYHSGDNATGELYVRYSWKVTWSNSMHVVNGFIIYDVHHWYILSSHYKHVGACWDFFLCQAKHACKMCQYSTHTLCTVK